MLLPGTESGPLPRWPSPFTLWVMTDELREPRYHPSEVARLVGMHPARVRRWLGTNPYATGGGIVVRAPDDTPGLASFLDLVELELLRALSAEGFSYNQLRDLVFEAAHVLECDHPLARNQHLLEGHRIFLPLDQAKTKKILQLGTGGQMAFDEVVKERARTLDFDATGLARRWWPLGRDHQVVVDPEVRYGRPVIAGTGIGTAALSDLYRAENGNAYRVAELYEVPVETVLEAFKFETREAA